MTALRKSLTDSVELYESPVEFVGKLLHDLNEAIEYLDRLRTDPVTSGLVIQDCDEIEKCANRLSDVWTEIYLTAQSGD
jgi:hypothetical protein